MFEDAVANCNCGLKHIGAADVMANRARTVESNHHANGESGDD
jgi:hypothetical protein